MSYILHKMLCHHPLHLLRANVQKLHNTKSPHITEIIL